MFFYDIPLIIHAFLAKSVEKLATGRINVLFCIDVAFPIGVAFSECNLLTSCNRRLQGHKNVPALLNYWPPFVVAS
ncbi:MAG: hypothetical protein KA987_14265 [Saprospiraceae bacterium]|jgi:hypothetical protein|nr:hypothetical protein [Saprospiraceae bacterium]